MRLSARWHDTGGYRDVLKISFPLILSTASMTVQRFVDRIFLSRYSQEAIAAVTPGGVAAFTALCLFMGTASYTTTFVAQYTGARQPERTGAAVWQAIYFSLGSALLLWTLYPLGPGLFNWIGHPEPIRALEVTYFQILILGAGLPVLSAALAGFFAGRGLTMTIMIANIIATVVNILLNYALIFGNWGFPEWGIKGAAVATLISACVPVFIYLFIFLAPRNARRHGTHKSRLDVKLFARLMRYGFPAGVQFFVDMFAYTIFVFIVGRIGETELVATNIAFSINMLAFMPMIGLSIGTTSLVGQALGNDDPATAEKCTFSALHLTFGYMLIIAVIFVFFPEPLLRLFRPEQHYGEFDEMVRVGRILLRFAAIYCLFDTLNLIFIAALKGAGDTRYIMVSIFIFSWALLIIPLYLIVEVFHLGLYAAWTSSTIYICVLGLNFYRRYRKGLWKTMRVIERRPVIPPSAPEIPVVET